MAASWTHFKHVTMSAQLPIAPVQPDDSKSGQLPMSQPIEASESSSPLPQVLSAPPHDFAMLEASEASSLTWVATTFASVRQSVVGGNWPFVLPCSHLLIALVRPCTYLADALLNPRWHLTGSAPASSAVRKSPTAAAPATIKPRVLMLPLLRRPAFGDGPCGRAAT